MSWGYGYSEYKSVAELRAKAQKQLAKLRKKDPGIQPVIIEGRKITSTWWGNSWCENFKRYADFENRISRGAAYCKNGFVFDLRVEEGLVSAQVQGTKLYQSKVGIKKLSADKWQAIADACANRIDSMSALAEGTFPKELADIFMKQGSGLFPSPGEISFSCSCPDQYGDHMCKHIAAVLYGVGSRLDSAPLLLFKLRGIDPGALIKKSVEEKIDSLLANAGKVSGRVIDERDARRLFEL